MSLFDLTGKVAIITGSSRGIGQAVAEEMADHGAKVAISSRNIGPCEEVAAGINAKHPGAAIAVASSLSSKESLQNLVDETRKAFGKVDVLVCNAASNPHYGPMATITDEQLRKTLDHNIVSQHWLIQMVAPEMIARKSGSIVIVSSIGGLRGSPILGAYAITKAADIQMIRIWRANTGWTMFGSIRLPPASSKQILPRHCGKIRKTLNTRPLARRWAVSASHAKLRGPLYSWHPMLRVL